MTEYFNNCETLADAKTTYRNLSKEFHPDTITGSEEIMKAINISYEKFIDSFIEGRVKEFNDTHDFDINGFVHAEMLKKVIHFNMDIEVIGVWIYAKNCYEIKDQLKELNFWFSSKHKAWVFSGNKKKKIRSRYTTNDIRTMHGSDSIKEREERIKIS